MFESFAGTWAGKFLATFFISMIPIAELRVGLPYGIANGLPYPLALLAAVSGNMLPVPFIVVYIQRVFRWLRLHIPRMDSFITRMERKADVKGETVKRVGPLGLLLFLKQTRMPQDVVPSAATTAMEESRFAAKTLESVPYGVNTLASRA